IGRDQSRSIVDPEADAPAPSTSSDDDDNEHLIREEAAYMPEGDSLDIGSGFQIRRDNEDSFSLVSGGRSLASGSLNEVLKSEEAGFNPESRQFISRDESASSVHD